MAGQYATPGVYLSEVRPPAAEGSLRTGVPLFIGYAADGKARPPREIADWSLFPGEFGGPQPDRYLAYAVRGFFANGGTSCYVASLVRDADLGAELRRLLDELPRQGLAEDADLLCAPELVLFPGQALALQQRLLEFCTPGAGGSGRFALLDALPRIGPEGMLTLREQLSGASGALYYPWLRVADGPVASGGFVPPCGHVAGIYARTDAATGVFTAPANALLEEAIDLELNLTDAEQGLLNPRGINCLRSFPGRGIRVWGARTLSADPAWSAVPARRLLQTVCRWAGRRLERLAFEPHDERLWLAVRRELGAYLGELFRRGAFQGATAEEAYYVACDATTNPPEVRDRGELVVEVGIAPAVPGEFIVVRIVQGEGGAAVSIRPEELLPVPQPGPEPRAGTGITVVGIVADIAGPDLVGEHLLLQNRGLRPVELTNWRLLDLAGHTFVFPRFVLPAGATVRVWTKSGTNGATELFWGHGAPLWNNTGDTARLYDAQDHLIATFVYRPIVP